MPEITTVVDNYIAIWNERDAARRRQLIAATWSEDATYVDPHAAGEGWDAIDAIVAAVHEQFPGHRFVLADGPDGYGTRVRFTWHLVEQATGTAIAVGSDFGVTAGDGRLRAVTGFLEAAPAAV